MAPSDEGAVSALALTGGEKTYSLAYLSLSLASLDSSLVRGSL